MCIRDSLRGGQETKKLPRTYRFGDSVTLPETVKRKGYVFMGWSDKMYADVEKVESLSLIHICLQVLSSQSQNGLDR